MSIGYKILATMAAATAIAGIAFAAPAAVEKSKAATVARLKPQLLSVEASRDRQASVDLDKIISTPISAEMAIDEHNSVTELAQKALGLRNAIEYRRMLRERLAELRAALAENPNDAALRAEMTELEARLNAASDRASMMELQMQNAMQQQARVYRVMSSIMKSQHETAKAVINNIKP